MTFESSASVVKYRDEIIGIEVKLFATRSAEKIVGKYQAAKAQYRSVVPNYR